MCLCVVCGKKRTGVARTSKQCEACARKERARGLDYLQRKRNEAAGYTPGDGRNVKKWPMGTAATGKREGGIYKFTLHLDRPSLDALLVIRKRYKDAEYKAKREPQTHQLSRLVRETILRYEPSRVVVKPRKHRLLVDDVANLSLDGRTRAILTRQAVRSFGGNKSAALRAMLIECQGFRRAFTDVNGSTIPLDTQSGLHCPRVIYERVYFSRFATRRVLFAPPFYCVRFLKVSDTFADRQSLCFFD